MKLQEKQQNQSGITLVALVVTIIILIILATISIQMVIGEGGLIWQANNGKVEYRAAEVEEEVLAWKAEKQMAKYTDGITPQERNALVADQLKRGLLTEEEAQTATETGQVQIGSRMIDYGEDETPTEPPAEKSQIQEAKESQEKFDQNTPLTDKNGNTVVVPGKFHIAKDSGDTVQQGIVIEDSDGNQFVWIPVSNIDGGEKPEDNKPIKKDDGTEVTITLGRYENFTMNGTTPPSPKQKGSEYAETGSQYIIDDYYSELKDFRKTQGSGDDSSDLNTTARDLTGFINSVKENHGYYFGRYEASYGSGSTYGVVTESSEKSNENWYKPLVQPSTANSESSWKPDSSKETGIPGAVGTLWNYVSQGRASIICRNMYNESDEEYNYVVSDLVNSYMWDTAIIYIQAMEDIDYAYSGSSDNSITNTGTIPTDEKCHIFDMAGNLIEWTTEYSSEVNADGDMRNADPCTYREKNPGQRRYMDVGSEWAKPGFRPGLFIK